MRLDLYCEQTGQSQAARGSANGLTAILGRSKFSGDGADMEGKSCGGHSVGSSVGESDRGYAQGGGIRWSGFISLSGYFASLFAQSLES
jgi:hypothetical protein